MAYAYYASITVDADLVSADETNFPVLVAGTYDGTGGEPDLRTAANGGHVQNTASGGASGAVTVPADFVVSPNTDGSSPYDFEIESYNAATGAIVLWVEVPSLSSSIDTVFYLVYGDAGVSTSQENVAGVWDVNYIGVYHLGEASGTFYDSTGNNNDGADNVSDTGKSGKIGSGQSFDGSDAISLGDINALDGLAALAIECWVYTDTIVGDLDCIVSKESAFNNGWQLRRDSGNINFLINDGAWRGPAQKSISATTWTYYVAVFDVSEASASELKLYKNDEAAATGSGNNANILANAKSVEIGANAQYVGRQWLGDLDEMRLSNAPRDANYVATSYANQNAPGTFYAVGAENGGSPPPSYQPRHGVTLFSGGLAMV